MKIKSVIIFENGNVAVLDDKGNQVPELQKGWLNWKAIRKLARVIARDNPEVKGKLPTSYLGFDPIKDYVNHYKKQEPKNGK